MRICLIYDCLFPYTIGGGERWYRALAERLAAEGHEVTYLTLRQWDRDVEPDLAGVDVRVVGPRMELYVGGRRRIAPPLVFGLGVLLHLLRHGRRYDVVHTAAFPYFSLLAAALARPLHRYRLVVDWFEVWSRDYWRGYLGRVGGSIGAFVQRLCARVPQHAFCFSRLHAARLHAEGMRSEPQLLTGLYDGSTERPDPAPAQPLVVYAGRHIPEKRVPALVHAFAHVHRQAPELRLAILGDGPERPRVLQAIAQEGLDAVASAPGFVPTEKLEATLAGALCMVLPSSREGYGLVVVEAASNGVPSVVVDAPDNAAVELVDEGANGVVAESVEPEPLAEAILRVRAAGPELRGRTAEWFERNVPRLSLASSLDVVAEAYGGEGGARDDGPRDVAPRPGCR
ncbi:glycosyltransferase family 4 protein [Conexibacter arvalis]|uniref:Glycosyltransferase involved in cell wall biosynthesis n=1 Tax=Conexibacter arvalis TaxID=912552 RepID=A0A840IAY7_9ACTN|nr:glycosyltransferase family 4 protein [Conexibacter arvalis]MBB4661515.1 glycosyltransferase involved in cell wall biosynthesis [Conexibacter arvalis]